MTALEKQSEERGTLDWQSWMIGAAKLCALLQNEEDHLADMEHTIIKMKAAYIGEGKTAAAAKLLVEQDDLYLAVMKQRAFVKRCDETIAIAKKFATLSKETYMH